MKDNDFDHLFKYLSVMKKNKYNQINRTSVTNFIIYLVIEAIVKF